MEKNESNLLNFLNKNYPNVVLSQDINIYVNKNGNKCINEFEIVDSISRGLIWRVKKVLRYYQDELGNIQTEPYAMKKTHINTQKKHRFYVNFKSNKTINYFDKIIEDIEISVKLGKHPNIAALYEVMYNPLHQYIYLITEYCDLGTIMNKHQVTFNYQHNTRLIKYFITNLLSDKYKDYRLKTDKSNPNLIELSSMPYFLKNDIAKILFRQTFIGLKYIHGLNICHKDIKPENFVFSSIDNCCKFIDFSNSKMFQDDENKMINEPGGSIHFQAPELFSGLDSYYNPFKYDLWSIGISLYIFLAEEFPFDSESELELQIMISDKEIVFPKDFDDNSKFLLSRILKKNPDERLSDIDLILKEPYFSQ